MKASVIHERLAAEYGFTGNYQRVKLYVQQARPRIAEELGIAPKELAGLHPAASRSSQVLRPRSTGVTRARSSLTSAYPRSTRCTWCCRIRAIRSAASPSARIRRPSSTAIGGRLRTSAVMWVTTLPRSRVPGQDGRSRRGARMAWQPQLVRRVDAAGNPAASLGHALVDDYLEFVAARPERARSEPSICTPEPRRERSPRTARRTRPRPTVVWGAVTAGRSARDWSRLELCVGQAVAEGVQRAVVRQVVVPGACSGGVVVTAAEVVPVVQRDLADGAREGAGKSSAGIDHAVQGVGDGTGAFLAQQRRGEQGVGAPSHLFQEQRAARDGHRDQGFAGVCEEFHKPLLVAGKHRRGRRLVLPGRIVAEPAGPLTEYRHHQVGVGYRRGDRFGGQRRRGGPEVAERHVADGRVVPLPRSAARCRALAR